MDVLNIPRKRTMKAEDIFDILQLTPSKHRLSGDYKTIGDFLDDGGDIERLTKKARKEHAQDCQNCEPVIYSDIKEVPEFQQLLGRVPPPPRIPNFTFGMEQIPNPFENRVVAASIMEKVGLAGLDALQRPTMIGTARWMDSTSTADAADFASFQSQAMVSPTLAGTNTGGGKSIREEGGWSHWCVVASLAT